MPKPQINILFALTVLFTVILSTAYAEDFPVSIIAISSDQRPFLPIDWNGFGTTGNQPKFTLLNLNSVQSIEERLGKGLPNDPKQARATVDQRIAQIGRSQLDAELRTAYLPLGTMMAYGLDRYPVIIFDKREVIYGMTDLSLAINRHRQWLKDKNGGGN
ncbi:MAG: DUF1525 domain-containing protein [Cellvibrionaceae bacterium]